MAEQEMRQRVIDIHPNSTRWRRRVLNMSDAQVFAIFKRVQHLDEEREKLDEEWQEFRDALRDENSLEELFKQESLF